MNRILLLMALSTSATAATASRAAEWRLVPREGATATFDGHTLRKTNALGLAELQWSDTAPTKAQSTYAVRVPYRSSEATVANLLMLRATEGPDAPLNIENITDSWGVGNAQIQRKLLRANRTVVWLYNSGYISEAGKSIGAMSQLTGTGLKTDEAKVRRTLQLRVDGVPPFCGGSEMFARIYNRPWDGAQHFWVEDGAAQVLGSYAENGQVAAVRKKLDGWTSIFIGAPQGLSGALLNHIAREAGAFVASDAGNQINLSGEFASVHALRSGSMTLRLPPGRTRVVDAESGRILAQKTREIRLPVVAGRTYWFFFE